MPNYKSTPLVELPELALAAGVARVQAKVETSRFGLPSFKVLGASWGICRALSARFGFTAQTWPELVAEMAARPSSRELELAAATDGNHGRAVARIARLLGLRASIYVPAGVPAPYVEGLRREGAAVEVVQGGYDEAVTICASQGGATRLVVSDTAWPGYQDIPGWVIEGYGTMLVEIDEVLSEVNHGAPSVVLVQMGVGALAAAVVRHYRGRSGPRPTIVGIEPESAACVFHSVRSGKLVSLEGGQDSSMTGLNCGTPSSIAWPDISRGIDVYMTVPEATAIEAVGRLGSWGLNTRESGAAGAAGLIELTSSIGMDEVRHEIELNGDASALLFVTEGRAS